jgi:histidine triad (HIT) family protein
MNNTVSQSVPHLHLHVVPRTRGDGLRGFFWPRTKYAGDEEAAGYAHRLAAWLAADDAAPVAGPGEEGGADVVVD